MLVVSKPRPLQKIEIVRRQSLLLRQPVA